MDPEANREILLADLRDSPDVRREVNLCWMPLTPEQVVADLWADPRVLAAAGPRLSARERDLLARPAGAPWTVSDVPLLDEAAELLGEDDEPARRAAAVAASERAVEEEYARGVLEMTGVARAHGRCPDRPLLRVAAGPPHRGRRGAGRPDLGVRPRRGRRGPGALPDAVAAAAAPLPEPLDDRRRRPRPGGLVGGAADLGGCLRPGGARALVGPAADGQLPDPRPDDGARDPRPEGVGQCRSPSPRRSATGTPPRITAGPRRRASAPLRAREVTGWVGDEGRTAVIVPRRCATRWPGRWPTSSPRGCWESGTPPSTPA